MSIPADVTIFKLERLASADPTDSFYKLEFGFATHRDREAVRTIISYFVAAALDRTASHVSIPTMSTTGVDGPNGWWFFCTAEVSVRKTKIEAEYGI